MAMNRLAVCSRLVVSRPAVRLWHVGTSVTSLAPHIFKAAVSPPLGAVAPLRAHCIAATSARAAPGTRTCVPAVVGLLQHTQMVPRRYFAKKKDKKKKDKKKKKKNKGDDSDESAGTLPADLHGLMGVVRDLKASLVDAPRRVGTLSSQHEQAPVDAAMLKEFKAGYPTEALKLYQRALDEVDAEEELKGPTPSPSDESEPKLTRMTFSIALNCCLSLQNVERGQEVFREAIERGYQTNQQLVVFLRLLTTTERIVQAYHIIRQSSELGFTPSEIAFAWCMRACAERAEPELAMKFFRLMEDMGRKPTHVGFAAMMQACAEADDIALMLSFVRKARASNVTFSPEMYAPLIQYYSQRNDMQSVRHWWDVMDKSDDEPITNAIYFGLMRAHAAKGDVESTEKVYSKIEARGVSLVDESLLPDKLYLKSLLIRVHGGTGNLARAEELFRKTGDRGNVSILNAMLYAALACKQFVIFHRSLQWAELAHHNLTTYHLLLQQKLEEGEPVVEMYKIWRYIMEKGITPTKQTVELCLQYLLSRSNATNDEERMEISRRIKAMQQQYTHSRDFSVQAVEVEEDESEPYDDTTEYSEEHDSHSEEDVGDSDEAKMVGANTAVQ